MRRFFVTIFVLSLIATGATGYWAFYMPEGKIYAPIGAPRQMTNGNDASPRSERSREYIAPQEAPSERQELAVTISILSSVISALAAVFQTWLTARAYRR